MRFVGFHRATRSFHTCDTAHEHHGLRGSEVDCAGHTTVEHAHGISVLRRSLHQILHQPQALIFEWYSHHEKGPIVLT
ncbi:hypothetical protein BC834DRAFT_483865 [Gloeopeniophorella convolvens]|nr:hypothetical protein BC834DRAFT_483865 [Gloeopeniophorella convolvens]